jgi:hypothetical protein
MVNILNLKPSNTKERRELNVEGKPTNKRAIPSGFDKD